MSNKKHHRSVRNKRRTSPGKVKCEYGLLRELMASTKAPTPAPLRQYQLGRMRNGLEAIELAPEPTRDDWRVCSDAVNLMETLVTVNDGYWLGCDGDLMHVEDSQGLLQDAVEALAAAGRRSLAGGSIRLDGKGIVAVRGVLEDYAFMLETLPERVLIKAHRLTEKRIVDLWNGKAKSHDVEVIDL